RRGGVRAVVGTRAAMFAPVARLGLAVIWDDGDDLHAEPHAPYPHAREVLCLRALHEDAAVVVSGFARTAEGAALVGSGWARSVSAPRTVVRRAAPAVRVAGDDGDLGRDEAARAARLPSVAWQTVREGLERGPVLVQVPRAGYLPSLTCAGCRVPARCATCHGPLTAPDRDATLACGWCGALATAWRCPHCDAGATRARVVGARRTADELGRAFPRATVLTSGGRTVLDAVGPDPALVVATPGAEPVAEGGYAAAVLLDGWALLTRPDLRASEEALRRWLTAAALVRPADRQGQVVLLAEPGAPAVQALVRWDPTTFAERELADRRALRLPPAASMASLTGAADPLRRFLEVARLPEPAEVLGPVPVSGDDASQRLLVRVPRSVARDLAAALRAAAGVRSAHKEPGGLRVQVDPLEIA
ncbi:MAG: primosome assembly protein PriA, partial [Actinomycetes bacterium]